MVHMKYFLERHLFISTFIFIYLVASVFVAYRQFDIQKKVDDLSTQYQSLSGNNDQLAQAYSDVLFEDHLHYLELRKIEAAKNTVEVEYAKFKSEAQGERLAEIEAVYAKYQETINKIARNNAIDLDTAAISDKLGEWGAKFLNQEFDVLTTEMDVAQQTLDQDYQTYLAALPTPTPVPTAAPTQPVTAAAGYSFQSVGTERGTFSVYLVKMKLSEVTVKTVAANTSDCTDNCPAKSLAQYISENGAYAGMNGSYFCPPDYASCAGKVNSYDFALYDSNTQSWRNENTLQWYNNGLAAFNGNNHLFYDDIQQYYFAHGNGGVTAGISNFPSLVKNGEVIVDENELTNYQRTAKGARGAIGVDGTYVYLAIGTGATVTDMAYIMKALGAQHALNLDGGGSSALYINGAYKVGPGRSLPNAIVLMK